MIYVEFDLDVFHVTTHAHDLCFKFIQSLLSSYETWLKRHYSLGELSFKMYTNLIVGPNDYGHPNSGYRHVKP